MAQARRLLLRGASQLFNSSSPRPTLSSLTITRAFSDSKLFVGGLSFRTTEDGLRSAFAAHGEVMDVRIINDRETGKSRGFGFVTYYKEDDAEAALSKLNGQILDGRSIRVDRASSRPPAPRAGGFGGGGGGGGFGENDNTITSMGFGEASETPKTDDWGSIPSLNADAPGSGPSSKGSFGSSSLDSDLPGSAPSSKSSFGNSSMNNDYSGSAKSSYGSSSPNNDYSGSAKSSYGSSSTNNYSSSSKSSYGNSSYGNSSYGNSSMNSDYSGYGSTPKSSYGSKSNTGAVGRKSTGGTLFGGDDSDGEGTVGGFGK